MPLLQIVLQKGETIQSQSGAMRWMDASVQMRTNMAGGLGGFLKRKMSGESGFMNFFEAQESNSRIAFGHTFPGNIIELDVSQSSVICQKRAFLCSEDTVELDIAFQRRLGTAFFGGEGFILQQLKGSGTAFVEIDGECIALDLERGQSIKVDTGSVGMYEASVRMNIEMVKGFSNVLFGGEGLFLTTLTGPGRVWLQSMPIQNMAAELSAYLPKSSNGK